VAFSLNNSGRATLLKSKVATLYWHCQWQLQAAGERRQHEAWPQSKFTHTGTADGLPVKFSCFSTVEGLNFVAKIAVRITSHGTLMPLSFVNDAAQPHIAR
jgi:hypothetical protein